MTSENGTTMDDVGTGEPRVDGVDHGVRIEVLRTHDEEFTAFVREAGPYLHRTAYLLSGDALQAEELVQATFERVYRSWSKARDGAPRAYARRILVNLRIDGWRRRRRESFPSDAELPLPPTSDHASRVELRDELVRALARLSTTQRHVVVLRHLLDLPEAQVARELRLPLGTVKAANSRGLARLRDLFREAADAIEPVTPDEDAVLDASRRALRRRRTTQAAGAVGAAALLVLGIATRGPVPLPVVGPVVLPGGQVVLPLFEAFGWGDIQRTNTALACPTTSPSVSPARTARGDETVLLDISGEVDGPQRTPQVVDITDARILTCDDVEIDTVTSGSTEEMPAPLPDPGGLTGTGEIWHVDRGPESDGLLSEVRVHIFGSESVVTWAETMTIRGAAALPGRLTARGDRAAWIETAQPGAEPRGATDLASLIYLRTGRVGGDPFTVTTFNGTTPESTPQALALTRDTAVWTTGVPGNQHLYSAVVSSPYPDDYAGGITDSDAAGTLRADLGDGWTAIGGSDDEAVAARLEPGADGRGTTTIRSFDGDVEWAASDEASYEGTSTDIDPGITYDTTGTDLVSFEHDVSLLVSDLTVSEESVAWVLAPADGATDGESTLYIMDRRNQTDGQVRISGGAVSDLTAEPGVLTWNLDDGTGPKAYLYRTRPYGPHLARIPGTSVSVGLAGERIAWLEKAGTRQWLSAGTVLPSLVRD